MPVLVTLSIIIYLGHLGRFALREARGILKDPASQAGRSVIIDVHLRTELGSAEPELCACSPGLTIDSMKPSMPHSVV